MELQKCEEVESKGTAESHEDAHTWVKKILIRPGFTKQLCFWVPEHKITDVTEQRHWRWQANLSAAANVNFFPSSIFNIFPKLTRRTVEEFLSLLVAFSDTATRRHSEIKLTRSTTKQDLTSWGSIVKTKHQRLTGLPFMRLALALSMLLALAL